MEFIGAQVPYLKIRQTKNKKRIDPDARPWLQTVVVNATDCSCQRYRPCALRLQELLVDGNPDGLFAAPVNGNGTKLSQSFQSSIFRMAINLVKP